MAAVDTWVVTGSNRGIGLELVTQLLAQEGTQVAAAARDPDAAALLRLQDKHGSRLLRFRIDLDESASFKVLGWASALYECRKAATAAPFALAQAAAAEVESRFGAVDVLVNNAAFFSAGGDKPLFPVALGDAPEE